MPIFPPDGVSNVRGNGDHSRNLSGKQEKTALFAVLAEARPSRGAIRASGAVPEHPLIAGQ